MFRWYPNFEVSRYVDGVWSRCRVMSTAGREVASLVAATSTATTNGVTSWDPVGLSYSSPSDRPFGVPKRCAVMLIACSLRNGSMSTRPDSVTGLQ
ncbi:hypothetical protein B0I08_10948 [Glaciihabitans tibetensis]|uniref:Uncharacterized protein n=1 Tax=Glaciihabitans tibetensis TaxID=1266600 RepID=A0A2T0V6U7_9MICO|nr:hypothetical protein B0I08_10948 [Glaciihabitans tibetensis]